PGRSLTSASVALRRSWSGCFFFQAEDGIRDFHVTGVQTCALPISELALFTEMPCCCTIEGRRAVASCSLFCTCTWAMSGSVPVLKVRVTETEPLESLVADM